MPVMARVPVTLRPIDGLCPRQALHRTDSAVLLYTRHSSKANSRRDLVKVHLISIMELYRITVTKEYTFIIQIIIFRTLNSEILFEIILFYYIS